MPARLAKKIAAPMICLSAVLLGLGVFAAWNVNEQQQTSSDLISREVHGMLVIEELHIEMREIRYRLNQFLRTHDSALLKSIQPMHENADGLLTKAKNLARTPEEQTLIEVVENGYDKFFDEFQQLTESIPQNLSNESGLDNDGFTRSLSQLADELMTNEVLKPLHECIVFNQQVVERTNEANQQTAQHLRIGFLLLGVCGGAAGLLMGIGIARAVGRSIVQLNVSVHGMAGKLSDVKGPVTISQTISQSSGFQGVELELRRLEEDIGEVVERLQKRETELLRSEQLAQVGQLAAGLAHELRNPLMPMKMLVQSALAREDEVGLRGRSLQIVNDEIVRLEQSIQGFLDFARPPVLEKTLVEINFIIQQTVELVSARAEQQEVKIYCTLPPQPLVAMVDRTQIRHLVLNLLLNAIDALSNGGVIEMHLRSNVCPLTAGAITDDSVEQEDENNVKTKPSPPESSIAPSELFSEHDALRVVAFRATPEPPEPRKWFALVILDTGPGIPIELLDTIFEPFITTKETGTGLGLSICQRIAMAHQGELRAKNRPTRGAEFTLLLPYST